MKLVSKVLVAQFLFFHRNSHSSFIRFRRWTYPITDVPKKFNETIILFALVGYEIVMANSSLRASLAICRRRQGLQRKRHFEKAFTFIQTLFRLFQSAENVKCRRISLELISWGPHSSLERERKTHRRLFTSFIKLEIRHFHVVVMQ